MTDWKDDPMDEAFRCLGEINRCVRQLSSVANALKTLGLPSGDFAEGVLEDVASYREQIQRCVVLLGGSSK